MVCVWVVCYRKRRGLSAAFHYTRVQNVASSPDPPIPQRGSRTERRPDRGQRKLAKVGGRTDRLPAQLDRLSTDRLASTSKGR
jgi:hypothetical protein